MSSANYSSDEEVSPGRHKKKEKKMGQKNSILDYFKRRDKPTESDPRPSTSSGDNSPRKAEKVCICTKKIVHIQILMFSLVCIFILVTF